MILNPCTCLCSEISLQLGTSFQTSFAKQTSNTSSSSRGSSSSSSSDSNIVISEPLGLQGSKPTDIKFYGPQGQRQGGPCPPHLRLGPPFGFHGKIENRD